MKAGFLREMAPLSKDEFQYMLGCLPNLVRKLKVCVFAASRKMDISCSELCNFTCSGGFICFLDVHDSLIIL